MLNSEIKQLSTIPEKESELEKKHIDIEIISFEEQKLNTQEEEQQEETPTCCKRFCGFFFN